MNEQILKGKWNEIKGEIRKTWGNLTNDDLERTKGNLTAIGGLIQQKYGEKKEEVQTRLSSLVDSFADDVEAKKDRAEYKAAEATEKIKRDLRN